MSDDEDDDDVPAGTAVHSLRQNILHKACPTAETEDGGDEDDQAENAVFMSDDSDDATDGWKKNRAAHQKLTSYQTATAIPSQTASTNTTNTRNANNILGSRQNMAPAHQSSMASIDSRDGIQSFTSSTVASVATRRMERQTYNAFDPHGDMHIKSTGGTSEHGSKTTAPPRDRRVRTSRSGWAKGVSTPRMIVKLVLTYSIGYPQEVRRGAGFCKHARGAHRQL